MNNSLNLFLSQIQDLAGRKSAEIIDFLVYFLTVVEKEEFATPAGVERCFEMARLEKYSNIPYYLSRNSKRQKNKAPQFSKGKNGYNLLRFRELEIQKELHTGPAKQETSHLLRGLLEGLTDIQEKSFLQEAIDCYEIGARRATIVLVWILAVHHLTSYIYAKELTAFNIELAKNKDKRVKVTAIKQFDDFADIPEGKLIELARAAQIISNDVRKILDTKLGIRNSSGHPSSVSISEVKATDFVIDLVTNVLIKYKI